MHKRLSAIGIVLLLLAGCASQRQELGPVCCTPFMAVDEAGFSFTSVDGAVLPGRMWQPVVRPKAVILALHGFGDYSRVFDQVGPWWAQEGIATYALDQRGFGKAPGYGLWPGADTMAVDANAMLSVIRDKHPDTPVWLLGMSMGGAVALHAAARADAKADGLVLVAPAVLRKKDLPLHYRIALWIAANVFPGWQPSGSNVNRQPTDNIPLLREMARDPLIYKRARLDTVAGLIDLMDRAMTDAGSPDLPPVLLLNGAKDELVEPAYTASLQMMLVNHPDLVSKTYKEGWHMLLRDLQRMKVWQDIRDHILVRAGQ